MNRASLFRSTRVLGILALTGLALTGCGRRGELEAPPGSTPPLPQAGDAAVTGSSAPIDGASAESALPVQRGKIIPPRQPFVLDKIL